jgi:hypothetical protein
MYGVWEQLVEIENLNFGGRFLRRMLTPKAMNVRANRRLEIMYHVRNWQNWRHRHIFIRRHMWIWRLCIIFCKVRISIYNKMLEWKANFTKINDLTKHQSMIRKLVGIWLAGWHHVHQFDAD